jgi:hypothetical protein
LRREIAEEEGGEEETSSYLALTEQLSEGALSPRLAEFCAYYSNRMSYAEVARLVERMTGQRSLLSEQSIQRLVIGKAASVSERWAEEVAVGEAREEQAPPPVALVVEEEVDFYDAQGEEVLLMADAIQVKRQKAQRYGGQQQQQQQVSKQEKRARVSTDLWLVERAQGGGGSFEAITAGIGENGEEVVSAEEQVRWCLRAEYGEHLGRREEPLPIVAIADGAKAIRCSLESIFGQSVPMILDWYHLKKKLGELMSMVAKNKAEKERHLEVLLGRLWRGEVQESVRYIRTELRARNEEKKEALAGYLEKHRGEIIDYERRKRAGKTIGSGRMEKGVDRAIGARQKKKGMSWSEAGSKALGILKVVEMNQHWEELWFSEQQEAVA